MFFIKKRKTIKTSLFLALFLIFSFNAQAESFRVHGTNEIILENAFSSKAVEIGVNDAIVIRLPEDKTFIEGVEISLKVPKVVAEWRDSVAWSLYSSISPSPNTSIIDYSGERLEVGTFDESLSYNIKVPIKKESDIKEDVYSFLVKSVPLNEESFIFFRLQLAMKGADDAISKASFTVSAKPILSNKGILSLKTEAEESEIKEYTVFVDGKESELAEKDIIISSGEHTVSIVSNYYRNELRTVTIEKAKKTEIEVKLRDIKPIIRLIAPEGARIFFDEKEFSSPAEPFYTFAGEHTVRFLVSDYEIVRTLTVENGRNYNISVGIDVSITEVDSESFKSADE